MKKFEPEAKCPKCGFVFCKTAYQLTADQVDYGGGKVEIPYADFLLRVCMLCGYSWNEACIDAGLVGNSNADRSKSLKFEGELIVIHNYDIDSVRIDGLDIFNLLDVSDLSKKRDTLQATNYGKVEITIKQLD